MYREEYQEARGYHGVKNSQKRGNKQIVWGKGMDFRNGAVLDDEALGDRYGVGFPKGVEVQIKIKEWYSP